MRGRRPTGGVAMFALLRWVRSGRESPLKAAPSSVSTSTGPLSLCRAPDAASNPMGAAALVLADNELAIHGTNNPGSIGGLVSAGCIRMHNKDIMDLFARVAVGTRVVFER